MEHSPQKDGSWSGTDLQPHMCAGIRFQARTVYSKKYLCTKFYAIYTILLFFIVVYSTEHSTAWIQYQTAVAMQNIMNSYGVQNFLTLLLSHHSATTRTLYTVSFSKITLTCSSCSALSIRYAHTDGFGDRQGSIRAVIFSVC